RGHGPGLSPLRPRPAAILEAGGALIAALPARLDSTLGSLCSAELLIVFAACAAHEGVGLAGEFSDPEKISAREAGAVLQVTFLVLSS
ncbi:MAG: hypothetical protein AAGG47_17855, partial [Pseudomonadota bacterium]